VTKDFIGNVLVAIGPFADGKIPALALFAFAADDGEGYHHPVAHFERAPGSRPDFHDLSHGLVTHDVAGLHAGHEVVEEMKIRAADRATGDLDDGIAVVFDVRIRNTLETNAFIPTSTKRG
jgi:hypothetical protein